MSWYRTGKVTAAAGKNIITGTGTQWANNVMGIAPGQALIVPRPDGNTLIYEILAVDSDTKIRINGNIVDVLTSSGYGIQTSVSNSYSALARETSAQLGLYQQLLKDWQDITTGTGNVTIIAPDGSTVVIPSLAKISQDLSNKVNQSQLSGVGIGLPTLVGLTSLDWQQKDFLTGANYIGSNNVWTNTPAGVSYNAGTGVSITVDYISSNSTRIGLTLVPDTTLAANFKVYKVLSVGAKGSRVFTVREELTSANPVPIAGGGTGATTAPLARTALGLGSAAVANTGQRNGALLQVGTDYVATTAGRAAFFKSAVVPSFAVAGRQTPPLEITNHANNSASAPIVFHREGLYRTFFGLNTDNTFSFGGGSEKLSYRFITQKNSTVDSNGFFKKASPVVKLYGNGSSETNHESQGATSERISEGVYKISGVLGFNSDDAWGGVDGGIEIPTDKNKQPLIWIDYELEENGDLIIKTYHRTHPTSPAFAQNNIKDYEDGQPIDIPAGRFVDLRVQMPGADVDDIIEQNARAILPL